MCYISYKKNHRHKYLLHSESQPSSSPWSLLLAKQEARGLPRLDPGASGSQKAELPEVSQTGVVPQSLCEGLCSFITDSVAPHPEGRGKTVNVSSCTPLTFCRSPHLLYSPRQRSLLCPGSSGLEKIPTEDPYRSCCRFQMRREM